MKSEAHFSIPVGRNGCDPERLGPFVCVFNTAITYPEEATDVHSGNQQHKDSRWLSEVGRLFLNTIGQN